MRITLTLLLVLPAMADVSFREDCVYEATLKSGNFERTTWLTKDKLRVDETEDSTSVIYRFDKKLCWFVAGEKGTYMEMPILAAAAAHAAEAAANKKGLEALKAKLEKEIADDQKKLSAEKDPAAKKTLQDEIDEKKGRLANVTEALALGKPVAWVSNTKETDTILDNKCTRYKVFVNGNLTLEAWMSGEIPGAKDYHELMAGMHAQMGPDTMSGARDTALLKETKGIPLKRRILQGSPSATGQKSQEIWIVSTVTELSIDRVNPDAFDLAPGLQKQ